ncbi:carboxylic ester hydrolase-like [Phymastichus coffea]|uniref:carboxylic ester hydrolase-like n=1 Tax=Phymastichus coffea TaxID=108790 RepID=UPI00273CAF7E|nr:carboxylic ester hydrolase-like [Phymastichus coffea]
MENEILVAIFFALWAIIQISASPTYGPLVITEFQKIRGRWNVSYAGRPYKIFEGIPYAEPPVGELRFKPPQPITKHRDEVVLARQEPNKCIQYDYQTGLIEGVEDCLFMNIYVPMLDKKDPAPLPVIIWFHEGAFQRGAGTYTKARYIMDRDVILVTFNYRLGIFGFLSTEDNVASGNMALKDQNLAIKWVINNIAAFGGNPDQISLFGASAGGSSVHFHYLSKMSSGLFKNGISFSGTALSPWAFDPKPLQNAKRLAVIVNCTTKSSEKMVECLKKLSAQALAEGMKVMLRQITDLNYYYPLFIPVAERNVSDYFISKSPEEILKEGDIYDVPWTSGVVSEEGGSTISSIAFNLTKLNYTDTNWEYLTPFTLMYNKTLPLTKHAEIARLAREHYVGNLDPFDKESQKTIMGLLYMKTHAAFHVILEKSARLQAKANKSPVYAYYYSYRGAQSETDYLSGTKFNFGVSHLDDIFLVLENKYIDPTTTEEDRIMLDVMLDFWVNAAKTGIPSLSGHELPRVDPDDFEFSYVEIAGPNKFYLRKTDNFADKKFWNKVGYNLDI